MKLRLERGGVVTDIAQEWRRRAFTYIACLLGMPVFQDVDKDMIVSRLSVLDTALRAAKDHLAINQVNEWVRQTLWKKTYMLRPKQGVRSGCMTVCVTDPTSVAHAVRYAIPMTFESIIHFFVARGIPFRTWTLTSLLKLPAATYTPPSPGLGIRNMRWQATVEDYAAYEAELDTFFSAPQARAALMGGGIVWRLAVEHVPCNVVTQGVSAETNSHVYEKFGETIWKDDALSATEQDLICGTYHQIERQ